MNLLRISLAGFLCMQSAIASACSCIPIEALTAEKISAEMRKYPVLIAGKVKSIEKPAICRIALLRWAHVLFSSRDIPVKYQVTVTRSLLGKTGRNITVIQDQWVDFSGCHAGSEVSCDITFRNTEALWVLKPAEEGAYRRAGLCLSSVVLDALTRKSDQRP